MSTRATAKKTMNRIELLDKGVSILTDAGFEEAKTDAMLLMEYICGADRNELFLHGDVEVTGEMEEAFLRAVEKRLTHIPVQHITGVQNFMGLDFKVSDKVLCPRQDTEILVEEVMRIGLDSMDILDMCTGSGCIILSLLRFSHACRGVGVDISEEALEIARANAEALGLDAEFVRSDLFADLKEGQFDIIVSNPPYIRTEVIDTLMPEVRDHEPHIALDGDEDGLVFYRRICQEGYDRLRAGGMIFFEIGYDQADDVRKIMEKSGFDHIETVKDYGGNDRVAYGVKN